MKVQECGLKAVADCGSRVTGHGSANFTVDETWGQTGRFLILSLIAEA